MPPPLAPLVERWRDRPPPHVPGRLVVPAGLRAFFLGGLEGPVLAVVAGEREAEELAADLSLFVRCHHLPAWETLPFEHVSPNTATMARRAQARHALASGKPGVVVASVRAATQRVSPSPVAPIVVRAGQETGLEALVDALSAAGYHRTERVETRGEMAVRGGLVDVYAAQAQEPVRVDFWGDQIEEMSAFSVATQRSSRMVDELVAYPAREFRSDRGIRAAAAVLASEEPWAAATWERIAEGVDFPGMESWLPWLAGELTVLDEGDPLVVLLDPSRCADRSRELVDEETELAAALAPTWGKDAAEHPALYLPLEPGENLLEVPPVAAGPGEESLAVSGLDAVPGDAESVAAGIKQLLERGMQVVVAMDGTAAAERVSRLLGEAGVLLPRADRVERSESVVLSLGVHRGFVAPGLGVAVLGEEEIAGRRRAHRRPGRRAAAAASYADLSVGDYVVHHRHGIGRFEGLVTSALAGIERDYLLVAYAGEDRLYVPTDQLAAVRRYAGGEAPRLSRMGGADWERTRGRVRRAVAAVAEEVVALHRERASAAGHAFEEDTPWQREMEGLFPYEETPDQLTAITDTKQDMESAQPMDRLIFGDVGFGKTEVAVRAAFKAVQSGKQAAVLVPTTLLAQQHQQTFSERYAPYPVRVEMLSRFLTTKQQRRVLAGLADGTVDVVIGTHRLLSDDVSFRDLGLLIVDEEQRFGVAAKDRIKALRTSVDVLTLTATPIPRTLEMALTGIRNVSRISTPPEDRHPILTFVGPYDEQTVSAAIRREMLREGQVFYVHNRIQSIDRAVARLRELVPEARCAVAHGRMNEGELEQVMLDFWNGAYDVLVATTIIESGLDLPQVNTLMVERADLLGLAQLYQLRGRVGRSSQRAYAYLFHPTDHVLPEDAYRRLEAVGEYGELGSGFQLAMRDLEIRGAGSVLGNVQSGHLNAVGFDLYVELVAEAVRGIESSGVEVTPSEVRIELPITAHLPDDYVADQTARLEAYRRLAAAAAQAEVDDVAAEWVDRYGPLPPNAEALIEIARLRVEALRLGLTEVVQMRNEVKLQPVDLGASQEVRLRRLAPKAVLSGNALFVPAPRESPAAALAEFITSMWPDSDTASVGP
jgi:transcription-repair coupling factor (superfamily II helicase)